MTGIFGVDFEQMTKLSNLLQDCAENVDSITPISSSAADVGESIVVSALDSFDAASGDRRDGLSDWCRKTATNVKWLAEQSEGTEEDWSSLFDYEKEAYK